MSFMKKRIERDFETFVKNLGALEPVEFAGLAKILSVDMIRREVEFDKEKFEQADENEAIPAKMEEVLRPMDEVLEEMMDRFLALPKHRRKEINQILKEIRKTKGVNVNGPTT